MVMCLIFLIFIDYCIYRVYRFFFNTMNLFCYKDDDDYSSVFLGYLFRLKSMNFNIYNSGIIQLTVSFLQVSKPEANARYIDKCLQYRDYNLQ